MGALGEVFYLDLRKAIGRQAPHRRAAGIPRGRAGPFDGVFCFPSVEADCIEGGGKALFDRNEALINEFEVGDPLRYSLEFTLRGGMAQLAFDTAGRVTLPENLCEMFGLTDWVAVVGLGDRFQIWSREAFQAERAAHACPRAKAWPNVRAQQRQARIGGGRMSDAGRTSPSCCDEVRRGDRAGARQADRRRHLRRRRL